MRRFYLEKCCHEADKGREGGFQPNWTWNGSVVCAKCATDTTAAEYDTGTITVAFSAAVAACFIFLFIYFLLCSCCESITFFPLHFIVVTFKFSFSFAEHILQQIVISCCCLFCIIMLCCIALHYRVSAQRGT